MFPFVGQLALFACNYAPVRWAMCRGQLLPISQNAALFSLLGTAFGGDGRNSFGLPDLRGRAPIGQGQGPGLSNYVMGEFGGTEDVMLTTSTIPPHTHGFPVFTATGTTTNPNGALPAKGPASGGHGSEVTMNLYNTAVPTIPLAAQQVAPVIGGGQPHNNLQPLLALNWCISLTGIFPSRP